MIPTLLNEQIIPPILFRNLSVIGDAFNMKSNPMISTILVVEKSSNFVYSVRKAFPNESIESYSSLVDVRNRMKIQPNIRIMLLDIGLFPNSMVILEMVRYYQKVYPDVPIVIINRDKNSPEFDSTFIIGYGVQDILDSGADVDTIKSSIVRSIARQIVRRSLAPIESEISKIKSEVDSHALFVSKCACSLADSDRRRIDSSK